VFLRGGRLLRREAWPWAAAAVLAVAIVVVLLTWDDGSSRPTAAPPPRPATSAPSVPAPSTSAPDTASPVPVFSGGPVRTDGGPPQLPDSASGLTVTAAETVARFWFAEAQNYAKATGQSVAMRRVQDPACTPCAQTAAFFEQHSLDNRQMSGDVWWRDVDVREVRSTGPRSAVVEVNARLGTHAIALRRGAAPKTYPATTYSFKVTLRAQSNDWQILDLELR
jgi:hypothetical protein